MTDAYLIAAARTPIGSFLGGLKSHSAPQLGAIALRGALDRCGLAAHQVDEAILGNVLSAGLGQAAARQASLQAGLPETMPAMSINKVCGSGLKAVMLAAQAVRVGDARVVLAGGMESMSQAPHLLSGLRTGQKLGSATLLDSMIHDGLTCAFDGRHMGALAEATATRMGVPRAAQDAYAAESQRRACAARQQAVFQDEIVPVPTTGKNDTPHTLADDECPRPDTCVSKLAQLPAVFQPGGTVTAGNASTLSDGAAAVVVADQTTARQAHTAITARIVAYHAVATAPADLFLAPAQAVQGVLEKAQLGLGDIDLFEINEAFAAQILACLQLLPIDPASVNIFGGSIALGHPIGASGARILVTLLHALQRQQLRFGLATLCLGGGSAVAMIVERLGDAVGSAPPP